MVDQHVITTNGASATLSETDIEELRNILRGRLIRPLHDGYEESRKIWNGMIDRKPALIARCAGTADVIDCVNFARNNNLLVSVRGGDHSAAGNAVCEGGLMIDLAPLNFVDVDPNRRVARAGGGARWRDFDHETQKFGLATTGGTNSDTGIGGLTLGGGIGWLSGKYGLACDNLLSVGIVAADGRYLKANPTENPDLFWGVRGGSGNFGVVTSFEYQLHPVGPTILGGMVIHPFAKAREVLKFYSEFSSNTPDELNTMGVLLTSAEGAKLVAIAVCYNGAIAEGEQVLRPLKEFGPPVADQVGPMPYVALQAMLDNSLPRGGMYYWKSQMLQRIGDDLINELVDHFSQVPSPRSLIVFQQMGNAARRVGPEDTAFSHRDACYDCIGISAWEEPSATDTNIQWTRGFFDKARSHSSSGIYVNGVIEQDFETMRAVYRGGSYDRLVELKNKYDPTNFFRMNPNIQPKV
jgi:hypothetical protein